MGHEPSCARNSQKARSNAVFDAEDLRNTTQCILGGRDDD